MKESKLGQEPAFPVEVNVTKPRTTMGISKRFYAACAAMQGILSNQELVNAAIKGSQILKKENEYGICKMAYEFADELLNQEKE